MHPLVGSSPNPWLLADLKETLLEAEYDTQVPSFPHADAKSGEYSSADADAATAALDTTARSNFRNRERASAVTSPDVDEDKTVVVVRVALPSPDQQEQVSGRYLLGSRFYRDLAGLDCGGQTKFQVMTANMWRSVMCVLLQKREKRNRSWKHGEP